MLTFKPQYKHAPWGGRRLTEELGRGMPEGPIGESWELVDFGEHHSVVARGASEGKRLGELWQQGALGGRAEGEFPFLLKWLDTHDSLSVQVHPDAAACERLGKGRPKTEAWFVAHAEPKSSIYLGHYPGLDAATLEQAAQGGTVHKWMYETQPRTGDMLLVPAGTLHAIGAGFILLEVQQPSDTTYRVYDWGRRGLDGNPRELHLREACESVAYDRYGSQRTTRTEVTGPTFVMSQLPAGATLEPDRLRVLVAPAGPVKLATARGEQTLEFGDVIVAEPDDGRVELASGSCILISEPA